ncbi:Na+/H+ antiporter NhaC family protein [Alteribacillus iranensis]|uniref:Na+/H+ antiporter NhaC n=1 Tax=Alteribacillus iranensis TaxID=930128 RepID=A0A1I2BPT5_9BACI|nr:Na+/H+ antiporter NhaC family protein [Alteribacillus iranensis]SFE58146.1 Na+/H+ antiporter NhaC [Alteribacillus iranensis]
MDVLSIVPPLVAVVLAIVTRRVLLSLFLSIWVGGLIAANGNPFGAVAETFTWMKDVMIDPWNARFLVLIAFLGAGAALLFKTGGTEALIKTFEKRITNGKRSLLFAYILGILIFFNDYVNSVIVGNASKDLNARYRVSREKLAYVLDATAAPMATIGPVSDWIGFQVALIAASFASLSLTDVQPYAMFLQSIPWNFYAILSLLAVLTVILGKDFGPMAKAEKRARETGKLVDDEAVPLSSVEHDLGEPFESEQKASVWYFVLPLVTLIVVGVFGLWYTGGGMEGLSLMEALENTDVSVALTWAAFAMTLVGFIIGLRRGMSLKECEETVLAGIRTMLPALIIMVLAWSIGAVVDSLGTAEFVVRLTEGWMTTSLLPLLIFVIAMFISFATGTSWGTMTILTPIAVPLAFTISGVEFIPIVIGAIFAGAIFGDHISPISDTTVMASIFAGSDHIAHVTTQIPYALVTASVAGLLYILSAFIGSVIVLLLIGIVLQTFLFRFFGRRSFYN